MNQPPSIATVWLRHLAEHPGEVEATGGQGQALGFEAAVSQAAGILLQARERRRKAMVIGNGGSAAIASHLQTDLCHSLGIRGLVFNEPPLLTALANDHGYEHAFRRLVRLWADEGDVLVAISSSGRSPNILGACAEARERGLALVTYSGFEAGNPLRGLGDVNFYVASDRYGPVETGHAVLIHHLTDHLLSTLRSKAQE
jgi:D-sedoheptulose 7-phosphate isomerase